MQTQPSRATGSQVPIVEIGPLRLWSPVILAPMAGVTDIPFRRLCRLFGEEGLPPELYPGADGDTSGPNRLPVVKGVDAPAGLYVTEMVTSRALVEGKKKTLDMVRPDPLERVRSVQLYGVNPHTMGQAARILVEEDLADHIDLNFGCPVPKVTRKGGGAALPWKRDLFADLVRAVVKETEKAASRAKKNIPVTVKMRTGIDNDHETYIDAARIAEKSGVAAVALHARSQTQHYSGKADWSHISRLKDTVTIPVFGNGDIFSGDDAAHMMHKTGCDAVIVGRGCQGRPWLFRDIVSTIHRTDGMPPPTLREVVDIIERHAAWVVEEQGNEHRGLREMRKHIGWYLRGFTVGGAARQALNLVSTQAELHDRLHALNLDQTFPAAAEGPRGRAGGEKTPHLPDGWLNSPFLTEKERSQLHLAEDGASGG